MGGPSSSSLLSAFRALRVTQPSPLQQWHGLHPRVQGLALKLNSRPFSSTGSRPGNWLEPGVKFPEARKRAQKGRPRVAIGGSSRGTTVVWGDYGLRMTDSHRRISARQLKVAEDTIKQRLRGETYRLYKRVHCKVSVSDHGNDVGSVPSQCGPLLTATDIL